MFKFLALLALLALANAKTKHFSFHTLTTGDTLKLRPQIDDGPVETKWRLEACEGCKIVLSCVILSKSCDDHLLTIYDGESYHYVCGSDSRYVLQNSVNNKMRVSIETKGLRSGSYCRVTVTKPYTNIEFEEIDSSEHGTGIGATRNTSCKCGWSNKSPSRIVGGKETEPNEYPFIVALLLSRLKKHFCGGSLITPYHVLTAAHCTFPFRGFRLYAGIGKHEINSKSEAYSQVIEVEKIMDHPKYDDDATIFDISVLKLEKKVTFNEAVGPVCLPSIDLPRASNDLIGEYVKVMGWGHLKTNGTSPEVLHQVNLKIIDLEICSTVYTQVDLDSPNQYCTWAPKKDSCQGDSGGPVVWLNPETGRYTQVALVSYGRDCGSTDPGVNTKVAYFIDWIKEKINESDPQEICT